MKKAKEIVHTVLNYADARIPKDLFENVVLRVQDILEKKCDHPIISIARSENSKTGYKCFDCDKEVIAVKFEELP